MAALVATHEQCPDKKQRVPIGTAVCKIKADPSLGEGQIDKFARLLGA
jgi:hypothetical protein